MSDSPTTHIYVLLDRSGSMRPLIDDVLGGFNSFLAEQLADGADARMTLVQFDGQDPADVLVDAKRITKVDELTDEAYCPRGSTPLLDATGLLIERADARVKARAEAGKDAEQIVVFTITDGAENASRRFDLGEIKQLVETRQGQGWTFGFLSADLSAYDEARAMGYDDRSIQAYANIRDGHIRAFTSASRAVRTKRGHVRAGVVHDSADFFEGTKEAEDETKEKPGYL